MNFIPTEVQFAKPGSNEHPFWISIAALFESRRYPIPQSFGRWCRYSQYIINSNNIFLLSCVFVLVSISAKLVSVVSQVIHTICIATNSRILWYETALCFLDNVACGLLAILVTASLSQNTSAGPSIGVPDDPILWRTAWICSTTIRSSTSSLPNVDVSTVFWLLLIHIIGALLT